MAVIDIDDKRRQKITFGVNESICVRLFRNRGSSFRRLSQSIAPPISIDDFAARTQEPQGNLGSITVERLSNKVLCFVNHRNDCSSTNIPGVAHITAVYPKMSLADPFGSARCNPYLGHRDGSYHTACGDGSERCTSGNFSLDPVSFSA